MVGAAGAEAQWPEVNAEVLVRSGWTIWLRNEKVACRGRNGWSCHCPGRGWVVGSRLVALLVLLSRQMGCAGVTIAALVVEEACRRRGRRQLYSELWRWRVDLLMVEAGWRCSVLWLFDDRGGVGFVQVAGGRLWRVAVGW